MNLADVYQAFVRFHGTVGVGCSVHADCLDNHELAIACAPASGLWKALGVRRAAWPPFALVVPCVVPFSSTVATPESSVSLPVEVHTFHHDLCTSDWIRVWADHPSYRRDIPPPLESLGLPRYYPVVQDIVALDWDLCVYFLRPFHPRLQESSP